MKNEFKERFNYLMSLSNKDLRKEIENSNWVFILQELRYAGETIEAYENMRKEAIEELSKDYKDLPDIDEWYATDKQWHNYYFEKSEQDDYKIENTLNILNKVGGSDE